MVCRSEPNTTPPACTDIVRARAPPGVQQLDWYISQNPVEFTKLPGSRPELEKCTGELQVRVTFDQAGAERVGDLFPEI